MPRKYYGGYPMSGWATWDKLPSKYDKTKGKSNVVVTKKKVVNADENNHPRQTGHKEK